MKSASREPSEVDFIQAVGMLVRRVRAAAEPGDLSLTEMAVVRRLSADGAATTADLARAEGMKPQSMGSIVSALEHADMVRRRPHPGDGRQFILELTRKGTAVRDRERAAKRTWLAEAMAGLDQKEQATLYAAGKIMEKLARE